MKFFASLLGSSASWVDFVKQARGRPSLASNVRDSPHPAAELLETLRTHGAPLVRNNAVWSADQKDEAVHSGGYASTKDYLGFSRTNWWTWCTRDTSWSFPTRRCAILTICVCPNRASYLKTIADPEPSSIARPQESTTQRCH